VGEATPKVRGQLLPERQSGALVPQPDPDRDPGSRRHRAGRRGVGGRALYLVPLLALRACRGGEARARTGAAWEGLQMHQPEMWVREKHRKDWPAPARRRPQRRAQHCGVPPPLSRLHIFLPRHAGRRRMPVPIWTLLGGRSSKLRAWCLSLSDLDGTAKLLNSWMGLLNYFLLFR
jgi:hypothetical protein